LSQQQYISSTFSEYCTGYCGFGFNGKENDNEVKGIGNQQNYGFRIYDPLTGKFLSVDPLTHSYSMLTPYQFSSNSPIQAIDLDGKEGISYMVVLKNTLLGISIPIRRVIELDIYIATNNNGTNGAYTPKQAADLDNIITKKYNEIGSKDENGLPVDFVFNFIAFNPDNKKPEDYAREIRSETIKTNYHSPSFSDDGKPIVIPYNSITGVVLWNDPTIGAVGKQVLNTIRINPNQTTYETGHPECHELSHFLLILYGYSTETPNNIPNDDHSLGGWMKYATKARDPNTGNSYFIDPPEFEFSQDNSDAIIKGVPRVNDEIIEIK
jgi:RHS repeat-associated protein